MDRLATRPHDHILSRVTGLLELLINQTLTKWWDALVVNTFDIHIKNKNGSGYEYMEQWRSVRRARLWHMVQADSGDTLQIRGKKRGIPQDIDKGRINKEGGRCLNERAAPIPRAPTHRWVSTPSRDCGNESDSPSIHASQQPSWILPTTLERHRVYSTSRKWETSKRYDRMRPTSASQRPSARVSVPSSRSPAWSAWAPRGWYSSEASLTRTSYGEPHIDEQCYDETHHWTSRDPYK